MESPPGTNSPRQIMNPSQSESVINSVNGDTAVGRVTSLGQDNHVRQVNADRHPVTVSTRGKMYRIGTWNVNTMYQAGKLDNVEQEIKRLKIDILGISEVRWTGNGQCQREGGTLYYSGGDQHHKGVGVYVSKEINRSILGIWPVSERIIMIKIKATPFNINIVQVYAPTTESTEEEIESFYHQLNETLAQCKSQEVKVVMGDLNAKVGSERRGTAVGPFGLGQCNERGELWADWCEEKDLVILNTWYKQHPRRLWTWKRPGDTWRNQIDYIAVNRRFRNTVTKTRTYPGADCNSDHVPVIATVRIKLKKLIKPKTEPKLDLAILLRNKDLQKRYELEVKNRFDSLGEENWDNVDQTWEAIRTITTETAQKLIPKKEKQPRNKWITQDILKLMEERRKNKGKNERKYTELNSKIKDKCAKAKEEWIDKQCKEIEQLEKRNTKAMYEKIKELTGGRRTTRSNTIKSKEGRVLMETTEVLNRWSEYIEELFKDDEREAPTNNRLNRTTNISKRNQGSYTDHENREKSRE